MAPDPAPPPGWIPVAGTPPRAPSMPAPQRFTHEGFFGFPAPVRLPGLAQAALSEPRLAWATLALGFVAVFLDQANFLLQLVLGAPIFEELLKFGLALAICTLLRIRPLAGRLLVAWACGAAFGAFEHSFGYADEGAFSYILRLLFHTLSPGLSMLTLHLLREVPRPAVRWLSTLPATAVHFANNLAALLLGLAGAGDSAFASVAFVAALPLLYLTLPAAAPGLRRFAAAWVGRWPSGVEVDPTGRAVLDPPPGWIPAEAFRRVP